MARSSPASSNRPVEPRRIAGPGGRPQTDRLHADRPLSGRRAVVTGGSRGIGAAVALELSLLGADLILIGRSRPSLRATAGRIRAATGVEVAEIVCDVTNEAAVAKLAPDLAGVSILINNAGGAESAPFGKTDPALWRRMIDLNLTSVYAMTRVVAPAMLAEGWGRIVNMASTAGLKGYAYVSAYVAAKHGVVGLTRALALEFARSGVTVNAVCPGYTDTPMLDAAVSTIAAKTRRPADEARAELARANPMGRLVTPQEVAATVGWLCGPDSSSVTGQAIAIAGGEV